jgi:hypothetical protein
MSEEYKEESGALSDDELDAVAGGGCCGSGEAAAPEPGPQPTCPKGYSEVYMSASRLSSQACYGCQFMWEEKAPLKYGNKSSHYHCQLNPNR